MKQDYNGDYLAFGHGRLTLSPLYRVFFIKDMFLLVSFKFFAEFINPIENFGNFSVHLKTRRIR